MLHTLFRPAAAAETPLAVRARRGTTPARSVVLAGLALVLSAAGATGAFASDAAHPVVVELFQSQGCSSCPPANANLLAIVDRPDVLALSFGVTYWDQLGWKDTFAKREFTDRQWAYAHAFRRSEVFTPQIVVNGRVNGVGADRREFASLVHEGDRGAGGPALSLHANTVTVGAAAAPPEGADVLLVRYDPRTLDVPIRAGENGGRTLPHRNVVKGLVRLGAWNGRAARFVLPRASDPALATAVLVQSANAGPILAAVKG